jgi:hypothetical protein
MAEPPTADCAAEANALLAGATRKTWEIELGDDGLPTGFGPFAYVEPWSSDREAFAANVALAAGARALVPRLVAEVQELRKLREWAARRDRADDEIRALFATVDGQDAPEAWALGMAVLALLDGPPPRGTADERVAGLRALVTTLIQRSAELESTVESLVGRS